MGAPWCLSGHCHDHNRPLCGHWGPLRSGAVSLLGIKNVTLSAEICGPRLCSLSLRLSCPQPPSTEGHVSARVEVGGLGGKSRRQVTWCQVCTGHVVSVTFQLWGTRSLRPSATLTEVQEPHIEGLSALVQPGPAASSGVLFTTGSHLWVPYGWNSGWAFGSWVFCWLASCSFWFRCKYHWRRECGGTSDVSCTDTRGNPHTAWLKGENRREQMCGKHLVRCERKLGHVKPS